MGQETVPVKQLAGTVIRDVPWAACRHFSAEEKICIVFKRVHGEENIFESSRREGIAASMYHVYGRLSRCRSILN